MKNKTIGAIVAITESGVLGNSGDLPWKKGAIKGDLPHFRYVTLDVVVVMGRKTLESLDFKPLPGRINIVISTSLKDDIPGVTVYPTIALALGFAATYGKPIWFIGGASILDQVMEMGVLDTLSITRVHEDYPGDVTLDWDADFLYDKGFIRTSSVGINDDKATIESWKFAEWG